MLKKLTASAAAVLALAAFVAVPAFAGGAHCGEKSTSTTAWAGAYLQRTPTGAVTVAEVAGGSPAAKAGLKKGDIVTAVNGYELADSKERAECASKAECNVGSSVTYTIQRGKSTKTVKVKLEQMPADAANRFANREASFDPALAAIVMPAVN
jgi:S1-C subfamily serine protease